MKDNGYKPRIVDNRVAEYLSVFGAVCIEGPKWCGKTWTSQHHSKSEYMVGNPDNNFQNRQLEDELWNDQEHIQHQKIFLKTLEHTKQVTDRMYPDSKFIFLIYDDVNGDLCEKIHNNVHHEPYRLEQLFKILESEEFRKEIEKMGIEVVTTKELIGRKMDRVDDRVPNDPNHPHPSAKAWGEIVPKLAKKYKL